MNQQDQQAIDGLFQYLYRSAQQGGPRDPQAEALIQRYVQQAPPGLLYQMAQQLVAQQHTINQMRSQLASQQQGGASAGFGAPQQGYQQGYGQPSYQQPGGYQQPSRWQQMMGRQAGGGGGFLAGAGKLALGIGGGILGAEVLTNIFDGVGQMFDDDRGDYGGYDRGDDDRGDQDYGNQDQGGYDQGGYDQGGYDGGFDGGGFDDGSGF